MNEKQMAKKAKEIFVAGIQLKEIKAIKEHNHVLFDKSARKNNIKEVFFFVDGTKYIARYVSPGIAFWNAETKERILI